jgi:zinc-binding alcohol dehydrogenase family protein
MGEKIRAVGFQEALPISDPQSLFDFEMEKPQAKEHDLLVKIQAVSVNPIDTAVRRNTKGQLAQPKILGWDAIGLVEAVGEKVSLFKPGDQVFYAGDFNRNGSNAQYQLIDERLVGHAPKRLTLAQAAAMPLTSLTAWEALFEKLQLSFDDKQKNADQTLLIINGAGGVGSISIQLAKLAGLKVIATASRPETSEWAKSFGADLILNHRQNLTEQLHQAGYKYVDQILGLNDIDGHWQQMAEMIKPNGRIASITANHQPLDLSLIKSKSVTFSWEWMYTKSYYQLPEMITQHQILEKVSALLDKGILKSTLKQTMIGLNAATLRRAQQQIETNQMIGKLVVVNN